MSESAFVHAFLFVNDYSYETGIFDFDIYIGDSTEYSKNEYCGHYGS